MTEFNAQEIIEHLNFKLPIVLERIYQEYFHGKIDRGRMVEISNSFVKNHTDDVRKVERYAVKVKGCKFACDVCVNHQEFEKDGDVCLDCNYKSEWDRSNFKFAYSIEDFK